MKMQAERSFEVQAPVYQLQWHYTLQAVNHHQHPQENPNIVQHTIWCNSHHNKETAAKTRQN
jgi:hypothetical protein